jgi:hypothetical protein
MMKIICVMANANTVFSIRFIRNTIYAIVSSSETIFHINDHTPSIVNANGHPYMKVLFVENTDWHDLTELQVTLQLGEATQYTYNLQRDPAENTNL